MRACKADSTFTRKFERSSDRISEAEEGEKKLEIVCMLREARMAREKGQGARVR